VTVKTIRFKVVDHKGRTVSRLRKESHFTPHGDIEWTQPWGVEAKPVGDKAPLIPAHQGRLSYSALSRRGGQGYLKLPGLTLKWEKVTPILDRIAFVLGLVDASGVVLNDDTAAATLTIDQLRDLNSAL
jgi:hypothetical protein